ncbi:MULTISPECIES: hypothetical protein [Vibrio]|uniref:Uncharacterized protein n=2 Tax=Vibrio TaxID=662 RepID=A0A510IJ23_9VIBR|nr:MULTISPECIES: hypothetical protein [Vibrio]RTZ24948.1 hypothetical protein EKN09_01365 [Vibrio penaeicida]BBL92220.1 hypothetical protein VroAM7_48730 [Vibrio rotiferianus]GLQ71166.1 hypothetical protein GCM10007932_05260 [Vibrio penaeicida]
MDKEVSCSELFSRMYKSLSGHQVKPVKMPIILEPSKAMRLFDNALPLGMDVIDNRLIAMNGFLCPDGILHACRYQCHQALMIEIGFQSEAQMEKRGWIKLSNMTWFVTGRHCAIEATTNQLKAIELWYRRNELDLEHFEEVCQPNVSE